MPSRVRASGRSGIYPPGAVYVPEYGFGHHHGGLFPSGTPAAKTLRTGILPPWGDEHGKRDLAGPDQYPSRRPAIRS